MTRWLSVIFLWLMYGAGTVMAQELFMARTDQTFPEAMLKLQETIGEHGYKVSRVQRVDIGLTKSGYKTDKYRVVFFGRPEEIREISARFPGLVPYLPLKIAIFAEENDTILVAADPVTLFGDVDAQLKDTLQHWQEDFNSIFQTMRTVE